MRLLIEYLIQPFKVRSLSVFFSGLALHPDFQACSFSLEIIPFFVYFILYFYAPLTENSSFLSLEVEAGLWLVLADLPRLGIIALLGLGDT